MSLTSSCLFLLFLLTLYVEASQCILLGIEALGYSLISFGLIDLVVLFGFINFIPVGIL